MSIDFELPKHPVGTQFVYRTGTNKYDATVIGYHVSRDTYTGLTDVTYRIGYNYAGLQDMTHSVPRSTVDRALLEVV